MLIILPYSKFIIFWLGLQKGMRRYGSTNRIRKPQKIEDDEEGLLFEEDAGFDISPRHRHKKKSSFAQQKAKYIQHFPGGYKIESEVPSGTPVPFQTPPMPFYGSPYPSGFGTPFMPSPYHYPPTHPYFGGSYGGYSSPYNPYVASKSL
jgi:hypothetical protein